MFTDLAIYDFIWPVYREVTLLLSEEVTDLLTWGDFKHLIIENKVSHINIQWGKLNLRQDFYQRGTVPELHTIPRSWIIKPILKVNRHSGTD